LRIAGSCLGLRCRRGKSSTRLDAKRPNRQGLVSRILVKPPPSILSNAPSSFRSLMSASRILAVTNIVHRNAFPAVAAQSTPNVRCQPHPLAPARFLHSTTSFWKCGSLQSTSEDPVFKPTIPTDLPPDWQHETYGWTLDTLPRVILLKIPQKAAVSDVKEMFDGLGCAT
jgi:hypothetical protein